jgi:hypothetical protein
MESLWKDLEHVYDVIDIGQKNRKRLLEEGFRDFESLQNSKERLRRNEVGKVKGSFQTELYDFVCWLEEYEEQQGCEPDVMTRFTEEVLLEFQRKKTTNL